MCVETNLCKTLYNVYITDSIIFLTELPINCAPMPNRLNQQIIVHKIHIII